MFLLVRYKTTDITVSLCAHLPVTCIVQAMFPTAVPSSTPHSRTKIGFMSTSLYTVKRGGVARDFMVHSSAPRKLCNLYLNGNEGCLKRERFCIIYFPLLKYIGYICHYFPFLCMQHLFLTDRLKID